MADDKWSMAIGVPRLVLWVRWDEGWAPSGEVRGADGWSSQGAARTARGAAPFFYRVHSVRSEGRGWLRILLGSKNLWTGTRGMGGGTPPPPLAPGGAVHPPTRPTAELLGRWQMADGRWQMINRGGGMENMCHLPSGISDLLRYMPFFVRHLPFQTSSAYASSSG